MIRGFKIIWFLLFFSSCLYGQVDSIRLQIDDYEGTTPRIITKGRKLLLDKFIEGDIGKVKKIKDYLVEREDDDYFAFYPSEYWLILYWTEEYKELAKDIRNFDSIEVASYNARFRPLKDMLYKKLFEKTFENESHIKEQISNSKLDSETKQILVLYLDGLLISKRGSLYAQDTLNNKADTFLDSYPASDYEHFIRKYVRYVQVPKDWGMAFEFFSGYGVYTGNLSHNYTNSVPIGVAFDICYRNFELYLRDYIGLNKTKKDFDFSLGTWEDGSRTVVFLPEASLGYVIYNDNRFKISPYAGIGAMNITPTSNAIDETPELEELKLDFTTTYMIGISFDIKFGSKKTPAFSPKTTYGFVRIRYAYNIPRFDKKYEGMTGNMHSITIGFGGMARGLQRKY